MAELNTLSLKDDPKRIAYWRLENVNDEGGTHTLTNNNTATFVAAKYSNGVSLGASNTNKSLSRASNLGVTGGASSFGGWFKMLTEIADTGGDVMLFQQSDATNDVNFQMRYEGVAGTRLLRWRRDKPGVGDSSVTHNIDLGTTNWVHVMGTYDGTNIRLYVNGTLVGGPTAASGAGSGGVNGFAIGANVQLSALFASLIADDMYAYSRALSATEVQALYEEDVTVYDQRSGSNDRSLVASGTIHANVINATTANAGVEGAGGDDFCSDELFGADYYLRRAALEFDTSSLSGGTILSGTVTITFAGLTGDTNNYSVNLFYFTRGSTAGTAFVANDMDESKGTAACDTAVDATGLTSTYTFVLNSAALAAINTSGYTQFSVRVSGDYAASAPTGVNLVNGYRGTDATEGNRPRLEVDYIAPVVTGHSKYILLMGVS